MSEEAAMEFRGFGKIARLDKPWVVTEKIDGTNGQILISDYMDDKESLNFSPPGSTIIVQTMYGWVHIKVGSRNRWLGSGSDNFGFYNWVWENCKEVSTLGPGRHFGEWWGSGIQRNYGLSEKRFSLFNVDRWGITPEGSDPKPACFHLVPVIGKTEMLGFEISLHMSELAKKGSVAAPGFMNPEGIVMFHTGSGVLLKHTFEGPKHGNKEDK